MMPKSYVPPTHELDGFTCPYCETYAHQHWSPATSNPGRGYSTFDPWTQVSLCSRCGKSGIWVNGHLIYPPTLVAPPPHDDLDDPALSTYSEARSISANSPRAAAALVRLCLQQLVSTLGATSDNLNTAVGELVASGMPQRIQQAMDTVRFVGNEAVHPGRIDFQDDPDTALSLFELVNIVVETMVTQPKLVEELYRRLPATKVEAIELRDQPDT